MRKFSTVFAFYAITILATANAGNSGFYSNANNSFGSISLLNESKSFSVFPNPFVNTTKIQVKADLEDLTEIKVFNVIGREVQSIEVQAADSDQTYVIDLSNETPGIYFCTLYDSKGAVETQRILMKE